MKSQNINLSIPVSYKSSTVGFEPLGGGALPSTGANLKTTGTGLVPASRVSHRVTSSFY